MAEWADPASDVPRGLWRLWVARLRPGRTAAYRAVAETLSRPMFMAHPGCEGVHLLTLDDRHEAVLTRWRDADAVVDLHLSARYRHALAAIDAAGVLECASAVSLFPVTDDLFAFCRRVSTRVERVLAQLHADRPQSDGFAGGSAGKGSHSAAVSWSRPITTRASLDRPDRSSRAAAAIPPTLVPR
jgi:heme-degrading monooxygenase HmoA